MRHFGYDDKLNLKESRFEESRNFEEGKSLLNSDEYNQRTQIKNIELSKDSIMYLKRLFDAFSDRQSKKLTL